MDFFSDFNNFQKEIFKNIFANPLGKSEESARKSQETPKVKAPIVIKTTNVRKDIKEKSLNSTKEKSLNDTQKSIDISSTQKESPVQRPLKRKRKTSSKENSVDENSNLKENAKPSGKLNKSETSISPEDKAQKQVNIYETPRRSFLIPQDEEGSEKGLRRGRSKFRTSITNVREEEHQKSFDEMTQDEFLSALGLKRLL